MSAPRLDRATLGIAAGLAALAATLAWDASRLQIAATYGMGPEAAPYAVALFLGALALGHAAAARRTPEREPIELRPALLIGAGLLALIALIAVGAGFVSAVAALFVATAEAFGRRAPARNLAAGLVLGLAIYLLFAKALSLSLPAGPLERLL